MAKSRRLVVFNNLSLDGYFVDDDGQMSWAHHAAPDKKFDAFVAGNASGDAVLLFGRKTYELMASFWPTEMARERMPTVAEGMNRKTKLVASRKLKQAEWENTTVLKGDAVAAVKKLKAQAGPDLVVLGSGRLVGGLAKAGLVDEFQFVWIPIVLGRGRTLFDPKAGPQPMELVESKAFRNGNLFVRYRPA